MPQGRATCSLIPLTDSFHSPDEFCLQTVANYAVILDRLEMASYQHLSERCSSGTEKSIALAAKSTVTSAVMSATEKRWPAAKGASPNRTSKSAKKFFTRGLLRAVRSGGCARSWGPGVAWFLGRGGAL